MTTSKIGDKPMWGQVATIALLALTTFAAVGGWYVISAYFEAAAYERVTGKHVTTWDAIFLDLRVQEDVKE